MTDSHLDRFDVYRIAKQALAIALQHRAEWRGLPGELASQLERALVSVVLNIAEGAGRWTPADQRRHYRIARGSALEAAACLDIAVLMGAAPRVVDAVGLPLARATRMLNVLSRPR